MKVKKIIICVVLLFSLCIAVFGDPKYETVDKGQVVIVTRVSVDPPVNDSFFSQYHQKKAPFQNYNTWRYVNKDHVTYAYLDVNSKVRSYEEGAPLNSDVFLTKVMTLPKDRIVRMPYFRCFAGNHDVFSFPLDLSVQIVIPEGVTFVYMGSFSYDLDPISFASGEFTLMDEYDDACAFIAEMYGDDARLVRVPLAAMETTE